MDLKRFDEAAQELAKYTSSYMAYELRDRAGIFPYKIRITFMARDEESGNHFSETESTVDDLAEYEEIYQGWVKKRALEEAGKILLDQKG